MTRLDLTLKMTGADGSESIEHRTVQIQDHPDAGAHSSEEVRKLVTAAGLRTKTGRKLTKQTFSFTIKNPVYCALLVHNGQTYKASFPALVSEELWQRAQDCLRGKNKAMPKKSTNEDFPLRGLVKCGFCNAKLTAAKPKGRRRRIQNAGAATRIAATGSASAWKRLKQTGWSFLSGCSSRSMRW